MVYLYQINGYLLVLKHTSGENIIGETNIKKKKIVLSICVFFQYTPC